MCERCRSLLFSGRTVARQGGRGCWQRATGRSVHEQGEATYWSSMFVAVHKAPIWTFPRQTGKLFVFASVCLWAGQRQTAKRWKERRYIRGQGTRGRTWLQPLLIIRLWLEGLYVYVDFINSLGIDSLRPDRCCHRLKGCSFSAVAFILSSPWRVVHSRSFIKLQWVILIMSNSQPSSYLRTMTPFSSPFSGPLTPNPIPSQPIPSHALTSPPISPSGQTYPCYALRVWKSITLSQHCLNFQLRTLRAVSPDASITTAQPVRAAAVAVAVSQSRRQQAPVRKTLLCSCARDTRRECLGDLFKKT